VWWVTNIACRIRGLGSRICREEWDAGFAWLWLIWRAGARFLPGGYMAGELHWRSLSSCLMASISSSVIVSPTSHCVRSQYPISDLRWGWHWIRKSPLR
jgi:hypothetical protein